MDPPRLERKPRRRATTLLVSLGVCLMYVEALSSIAACGPDSGGGEDAVDAGGIDAPAVDAPSGSGGSAGGGGSGGTGGSMTCPFSDPEDLGLDPEGNGSLDLTCVTTGVGTDGKAWVRVGFTGTWLPSTDFYSWFIKIILMGSSGELGTYTRQRHAGVDDTLVTGSVQTASTMLTVEPNGALVVFDAPLTPQITSATIKSGMLKTQSSKYLEDQVSVSPFDKSQRQP